MFGVSNKKEQFKDKTGNCNLMKSVSREKKKKKKRVPKIIWIDKLHKL